MCNVCNNNPCSIVQLRRGPKGDTGDTGADGQNAQALQGDGLPTVTYPSGPTPADANAFYADTSAGGNWWSWNGTIWTDTGVQVSGTDGTDGENAFSTLFTGFTMPAATGASIAIMQVVDTTWMVPVLGSEAGQPVFVEGAGTFMVGQIIVDSTPTTPGTVALINLRDDSATPPTYQDNADPAAVIAAGARISPGGWQGPVGPEGTAATIAVGTTSTLAAGNPATVANVGTALAAIFDFGIPTGATGAAGYSPVTTSGNGLPSGGNNGDIYFRQVNGGQWVIYTRPAGVWTAGISLTGNRLLGYSTTTADPNSLSLIANSGDQWWNEIGSVVTMWVYNGTIWVAAISFSTGGGGGSGDFDDVAAASSALGTGRNTGTYLWVMPKAIQNFVWEFSATSFAITFDTQYQRQKVNVPNSLVNVTLNWSSVGAGQDCEWVFEIQNNNTAAQLDIAYTANRWTKNPGITHPVILNPLESAIIHCRNTKGFMNIICVQQNQTIIT